jgi:GAF domain-containing protein
METLTLPPLALLPQLTTAIASSRSRRELFTTIFKQLKPVIPVEATGILVLDQTGRYWQDWTEVDNYHYPSATQPKQMGYDGWLPVDRFEEYTLHHTGIMTLAQFKELYPEHPFGTVMWKAGLREMLFTPLVNGGKKLGVLFFNSGQEGTYTQQHLTLFKAVAGLVAVAVAHVLANEEILQREREKATLLSISEQLATIRDKHDLFAIIFEKLKPVFRFDNATIALYDQKLEHTQHLHTNQEYLDNPHYHQIMRQRVATEGNPYGEFAGYCEPRILTLSYLQGNYPHHVGVKVMETAGLKECVIMPLRYGGRLLATLEFHNKEQGRFSEGQMPLFRNVADQVAVAVANILANEEILEREREKALLLSLSEDMATIRDRVDLWRVMMEKVKPLLGFQESGCFLVNQREGTYQPILFHEFRGLMQQEPYQAYVGTPLPLKDSPAEWILDQRSPFSYTQQQALSLFPSEPGVQLAAEVGLQSFVAVHLLWNHQLVGLFVLGYGEEAGSPSVDLIKAIADQVAVAVANILANEEILQREREKGVLLSLSEDMATIRDRDDLWRVMSNKLQPVLEFTDAVVFIVRPENNAYYVLLINAPQNRLQTTHYQDLASRRCR